MMGTPALRLASATVGAAGLLHAGPAFTSRSGLLRRLFGVRSRLDDDRGLALTFDDGPHPDGTPAVLEALRDADARATFFVVGEQVRRRPELVREIAAAGHEVGVHCDTHRNLLARTPGATRRDIEAAEDAIGAALGRAPRLYRPPYGIFTGMAVQLARSRRWEMVLWSRDPKDFEEDATVDGIVASSARDLAGGEIVLLHDSDSYAGRDCWRQTAAAIAPMLEAASAAGLRASVV